MAESGLGLAALTKNQNAKSRYTVGTFPRGSVSPRMAAVLDRLSLDPVTRDIGIVSGPRDTAYNRAVGGAAGSQHKYSNALDLAFKGLPDATKKHVTETLVAAGVSRFGLYTSGAFHFDVRPGVGFWGGLKDAFKGMTVKDLDKLPGWVRDTIAGLVSGTVRPDESGLPPYEKNLVDNKTAIQASLPVTMQDPRFTPALAQPPINMPDRPATLTPDRALNAYAPPSRFPGVPVGKVTRAPLDAIPAALSPAPVGRVERAPLPDIGQFTTPARSLQHPVSAPKPAPLAAAPVGQVTRAPLSPATDINPQTLAEQYGMYRPSTVTQMPTVATPPSVPVGALPAAQPAAPPPSAIPAAPVAPAPVLAPALTPPKTVRDYPVAETPPAPPAATAYDVYSGMATEAKDNTGKNTVGMLPDGTSTVTNEWGVTTGMTPYGKQTAVGNLPGITGPVGRTVGKMAMPAVGGLLGGPLGGMLGALASYGLSRPGGILSGLKNVDTSMIAGMPNVSAFAKPNYGLNQFPGAPSHGIRDATFSNRSRSEMDSISPKASADISAGRGGLF